LGFAGKELLHAFKALLKEYHFEKPHYALGIYTPSEVLNGQNPKQKFTEIYKEAAITRREVNKLGCEVASSSMTIAADKCES
jgi:hypothetical protein